MESEEEWRYNEAYGVEVSTHGRVKNPRTGRVIGFPHGKRLYHKRGELSTAESDQIPRYMAVTVQGGRYKKIHILVLETFVGPRPDGYEADHIDHDGMNNNIDNLRWIPKEENQNRRRKRANRSSTTT